MANLMQALLQEAQRTKRAIKSAPGHISDQLANYWADWKDVKAPTSFDSIDGAKLKQAMEEIAGNAIPGGGGAANAIVYHGTPYIFEATMKNKFGEFIKKAIGTGEGNAAFGHGTAYVADRQATAAHYYEALSKAVVDKQKLDSYINALDAIGPGGKQVADRIYAASKNSIKTNEFVVNNMLSNFKAAAKGDKNVFSSYQNKDAFIDLLSAIKADPYVARSGSLYKVDLNDEMIRGAADWFKPVKDQQPAVLKALEAISGEKLDKVEDTFGQLYNMTAADKGSMFSSHPSTAKRLELGKKKLSDQLEYLNIRGISYLDKVARKEGVKPFYNHVVFDPNDLVILDKLK